MIQVTEKETNSLLTLPRNEHAFRALLDVVIRHVASLEVEYGRAAKAALFNDAAKPRALALSGELAASHDILQLLRNLAFVKGESDGNQ